MIAHALSFSMGYTLDSRTSNQAKNKQAHGISTLVSPVPLVNLPEGPLAYECYNHSAMVTKGSNNGKFKIISEIYFEIIPFIPI